MDYIEQFNNYYNQYLGISKQEIINGKVIYGAEQRKKPINTRYLQPLIVTEMDHILIYSIIPELYSEFCNFMKPHTDVNLVNLIPILQEFFDYRLENYTIRKMKRMTCKNDLDKRIHQEGVVKLTKEILMNNLVTASEEEKEKVWLRKKEEVLQGRQFVILEGQKIVSYGKVSNVDFGGGNLVVFTSEQYRNKGYGKAVASETIRWCLEYNVSPIYWVDSNNLSSITLAKSLGLQVMAEEIVVGTYLPD